MKSLKIQLLSFVPRNRRWYVNYQSQGIELDVFVA